MNHNGHEEYVLGIVCALLKDCAHRYPTLRREFDRDSLRLRSAVEHHGLWFLSEIMPAYAKHLDKCLASGRLIHLKLHHFGVIARGSAIPRLFRGLTLRVFDSSGVIRPNPDVDAIRYLRQLLRVGKRVRVACSQHRVKAAVEDFVKVDDSVASPTLNWDDMQFDPTEAKSLSFCDSAQCGSTGDHLDLQTVISTRGPRLDVAASIQRVADIICSILGPFDPHEWKPKHGPGAVSDQPFGAYKYRFQAWPDKLEIAFPIADFGYANFHHWIDDLDRIQSLGFGRMAPSKLIAVPKEISKPRLIASEPTSNQWCQQIIKDYFYQRVKKSALSRFISFNEQGKNGLLALRASHFQSHATIDLSSASDRVSCYHVERLFRSCPSLLHALWASRTPYMRQDIHSGLPTFRRVRKYSTMGNATIFPVQSLFFLSVVLGCIASRRCIQPTFKWIRSFSEEGVRVFGDDIIVPSDCAGLVVETLEALGLRVNTNKTFLTGKFRESCGVDAYDGHDVTPVSVLDVPRRSSPGSIVSTCDVHNNFVEQGYYWSSQWIQTAIGRVTNKLVPFRDHGSGAFGLSDLFGRGWSHRKMRFNTHLFRLEAMALVPKVREYRSPAEGGAGLLQFFIEAPQVVTSSTSHLGGFSRRSKASLRLRWVPVV